MQYCSYNSIFVNIEFDLTDFNFQDLIIDNSWNYNRLRRLFGYSMPDIINRLGMIDPSAPNHWVWLPKLRNLNITSNVYHFLNSRDPSLAWHGWKNLWNINMTPRTKHFLWLVFRGRLLTSDLLNAFTLGPRSLCVLCGLEFENIEHLLFRCTKAQLIWHLIGSMLGIHICFPNGFTTAN